MTQRSLSDLLFDVAGNLVTTGSANAYVVQSAQPISGYYAGLWLRLKANFTNTGAATLDINKIGAADIRKGVTDALTGGEIVSGQYFDVLYDATNSVFQLQNASITYAKIQNVSATNRFLGRITAGSGDPEELTGTQATTLLDAFTSGLKGLAPASGGGTSNFLRADGSWAAPGSGLVLLNSGIVSSAATLDIVLTSYTGYRALKFVISLIPATDAVALQILFSTNGGSSFDASGYNFAFRFALDTATVGSNTSGSATSIQPGGNIGNGSTEGIDGEITLFDQTSAAKWSRLIGHFYNISSDATPAGVNLIGGGSREAAQDTDAIRYLFSSGNIASGKWAVYGLS